MKKFAKYIILICLLFFYWVNSAQSKGLVYQEPGDTLKFPFNDDEYYSTQGVAESPLYLDNPSNIKDTTTYDPKTNEYIISKKIGTFDYRPTQRMTISEYQDYQFEQAIRDYWRQRAQGGSGGPQIGLFPNLRFGGEAFNKIFGSNAINIIPMGSAELIFKVNINNTDNPTYAESLRKTTTFDFEEKIKMNVTGTIGDKIKLSVRYDTEATFDFENETKLEYVGDEDEIIKRIEAGNVTLPLPGSLITGSQSLFGLKTEFQFGKLTVTSVFSQQKGETKVIELKGGAQTQKFELSADEYDANRHFFLGHYFKDHYDEALEQLPLVRSSVNITRIEVWITNDRNVLQDTRNILALLDIAERDSNVFAPPSVIPEIYLKDYPDNASNELYNLVNNLNFDRNFEEIGNNIKEAWGAFGYTSGKDYEKIGSAKKLNENEFTLNERLGYISLNFALQPGQKLAVVYEFDVSGEKYKVGEFSDERPEGFLIAKLLKGVNQSPAIPTWDLMMKNIYSTGAYQINKQDFIMDVLYQDDKTGNAINYIPEGKIKKQVLLKVLNLDRLNSQNDAGADGRFDFVEGYTINESNGRIIFPVREPFGSYLRKQFDNPAIADKYVFQELYDTTVTYARLVAEKNKFRLKGEYKSELSSEIPLNAINIPQGSVKVMSGGNILQENLDYTVDYNLGRVKIINAGLLESGAPIQISLESNTLYSIQTKTLLGTHLNYQISDNFNVGATVMNLTERPLTQKVAIGEEPISNTIWGLNTSFRTESQFLTTLVDKLPFIETKETSSITVDAEFAQLIPGHSKAIEKEGNAYIDDFEGSETSMDLKSNFSWVLASTPADQFDIFPETQSINELAYGYNRAKLAWYRIDPLFLRNTSETPSHIKNDPEQQSNHFVREIYEKEIFPNKESENSVPNAIQVLNLAYYPNERGPYNYVTKDTIYAKGLEEDGTMKDPKSRWAGIMRETPNPDFEAANVNYIEFWLMDPFVYDSINNEGGDLYFNLGEVSEDVLKDSRSSFEDGLPTENLDPNVTYTPWGRMSDNEIKTYSFTEVDKQDLGMDGLSDNGEQSYFTSYLTNLQTEVSQDALDKISQDPSNDNFHYFQGGDYDNNNLSILERYKKYNNYEGNSSGGNGQSYMVRPDKEDLNGDRTLDETESYFQYKVQLRPDKMRVGQNYIVDKVKGYNVDLANGDENVDINWYQFRIPIREPDAVIGSIQDFKSIRFIRMFLTDFEEEVVLRFAKLELVRGEWRKYERSLIEGHENLSTPEFSNGILDISSVNIEENSDYVLPPGVDRVIDPTNPQLRQLNEQSMVLKVSDLEDGDARAAYKTINLDMRQYKKLKMFSHLQQLNNEILNDDDLRLFIRLGTDSKNNYYEYEIPLKVTPNGVTSASGMWPDENNVEIVLSKLVDVKQARNEELKKPNTTYSYSSIYSVYDDDKAKLSVKGNPNLSNVVTIMIGVRNPSKQNVQNNTNDDGMPKSAEVWVNELRLTDFKEDGGWAARGRVATQLADFGTINLSGSISTPGFGSIEKKVNERSKEEVIEYDVSANLDLGKFFPEESKVIIPMYAGYAESFVNPQYNPLDPDIELKESLDKAKNKEERDSIKNLAQEYTRRRSINFTNVKVNKISEKPRFYDPGNFSFSYAYNDALAHDVNTEYDVLKNYKGSVSYIYNLRPKNVAPFRKSKGALNKKAFLLIKDFNFYYLPSSIAFRTEMNRRYQTNKTRNINNPDNIIEPFFNKDFNWNRYYDVKWDLSRSLKIDFSATNIAKIDEPYGKQGTSEWKDSVWQNIRDFGRNTQYNHNIVTYRVPINKVPFLDWTSLTTRYNATYNWEAASLDENNEPLVGNDIRNSMTFQINSQANMLNLYNKVGFLKRINQKYSKSRSARKKEFETVTYQEKDINFRTNRTKSITHNLNTEDITSVKITDNTGKEIKGDWDVVSKKRISIKTDTTMRGAQVMVVGKLEKRDNPLVFIAENTALLLMSVKNISASYTQTEGSSLNEGYTESTKLLGMDSQFDAPGWPFVLGWQDENFAAKAIMNKWFFDDSLNIPFIMTSNKNINFRVTIEPIRGLKIDLTANRTHGENNSRYYYSTSTTPYNEQITGNFSMTYITIGSAFEGASNENGYQSDAFKEFKENRVIMSNRLSGKVGTEDFQPGYGPESQQVMVPSFLAAYGISDKNSVALDLFQKIPLPNWSIKLTRLKDIPFMKKYFKSFNISHTYRSFYNVGSYINNTDYGIDPVSKDFYKDSTGNYIPLYTANGVSINEQFSPLINVDMTFVNNFTARFELKKSRTVTLSFTNNQITEVHSDEMGFSLGYRIDNFDLIFNFGDGQTDFKSSLNMRANLKIRDTKTILRKISDETNTPSADQKAIVIGISGDYMLSNRLTLRLFYDQNITNPLVGMSPYRTSNTDVGFSLRFTLTE